MTPETALALTNRIHREATGLRSVVDQLAEPETGATMAGLKSAFVILAKSLIRTNQIMLDIVRAEMQPPAAAGHGRNAFDSFTDIFKK